MLSKNARLVLALTAATPLLFASCKDNNLVTPGNVVGTYQLTLFRGQVLPVTDTYTADQNVDGFPNGGTVVWSDGTIELRPDGSFEEINNFTATPTGGAPQQSAFTSIGTYHLAGTSINFTAPAQSGLSARNFTGNVTVNSITYQESNGSTFDSYQYKR
jgi:hypothetical protein